MTYVRHRSYDELTKMLGRKVHFMSDCEIFPNFDVTGKVIGVRYGNHLEIIFEFLNESGKKIDIGSNMKNLRYEVL